LPLSRRIATAARPGALLRAYIVSVNVDGRADGFVALISLKRRRSNKEDGSQGQILIDLNIYQFTG
jgi:hypothetical protein